MRCYLVLVFGLLLLTAINCRAGSEADSLYNIARQAYIEGEYEDARIICLEALHDKSKLNIRQMCRFHELLGSAYVAKGQREDAFREFTSLLRFDLSWQLEHDPSPKIEKVFEEARREYLNWLALPPADRLSPAELRFGASWRSAVLPGWGQFYKGQKVRGTVYGAMQLLSLVALVVLQSEVNRLHDVYMDESGTAAAEAYDDYRRTWRARNVSGYLTLGIYVAAYLDALYIPLPVIK